MTATGHITSTEWRPELDREHCSEWIYPKECRIDTFLGALETADDWMGTAYADDAEGAAALRRLLHYRGLIPPGHIVFGVDLWLTNDGGGKPKHKAPYLEVFVLDTTGFADAESAVAHALKSGDLHLG